MVSLHIHIEVVYQRSVIHPVVASPIGAGKQQSASELQQQQARNRC